jgi:hypothetical protein
MFAIIAEKVATLVKLLAVTKFCTSACTYVCKQNICSINSPNFDSRIGKMAKS